MCAGILKDQKRTIKTPGAGATVNCEPTDVSAGSQNLMLWKIMDSPSENVSVPHLYSLFTDCLGRGTVSP